MLTAQDKTDTFLDIGCPYRQCRLVNIEKPLEALSYSDISVDFSLDDNQVSNFLWEIEGRPAKKNMPRKVDRKLSGNIISFDGIIGSATAAITAACVLNVNSSNEQSESEDIQDVVHREEMDQQEIDEEKEEDQQEELQEPREAQEEQEEQYENDDELHNPIVPPALPAARKHTNSLVDMILDTQEEHQQQQLLEGIQLTSSISERVDYDDLYALNTLSKKRNCLRVWPTCDVLTESLISYPPLLIFSASLPMNEQQESQNNATTNNNSDVTATTTAGSAVANSVRLAMASKKKRRESILTSAISSLDKVRKDIEKKWQARDAAILKDGDMMLVNATTDLMKEARLKVDALRQHHEEQILKLTRENWWHAVKLKVKFSKEMVEMWEMIEENHARRLREVEALALLRRGKELSLAYEYKSKLEHELLTNFQHQEMKELKGLQDSEKSVLEKQWKQSIKDVSGGKKIKKGKQLDEKQEQKIAFINMAFEEEMAAVDAEYRKIREDLEYEHAQHRLEVLKFYSNYVSAAINLYSDCNA